MKFFYEDFADVTAKFSDDKIIKFNKAMMCVAAKNHILNEMFLGNWKREGEVYFPDIDSNTFRKFLNLVMGFEEITLFEDAKEVLIVAWKYQIDFLIEYCMKIVTASNISKDQFAQIFNVAVKHSMMKVLDELLNWNDGVFWFFFDRQVCFSLEPESMHYLMNTFMTPTYETMKILFEWAEHFCQKNNFPSVLEFLTSINLCENFDLKNFETTSELMNFLALKNAKDFFSNEEILERLLELSKECQIKTLNTNEIFEETLKLDISIHDFLLRGNINVLLPIQVHRANFRTFCGLILPGKRDSVLIKYNVEIYGYLNERKIIAIFGDNKITLEEFENSITKNGNLFLLKVCVSDYDFLNTSNLTMTIKWKFFHPISFETHDEKWTCLVQKPFKPHTY